MLSKDAIQACSAFPVQAVFKDAGYARQSARRNTKAETAVHFDRRRSFQAISLASSTAERTRGPKKNPEDVHFWTAADMPSQVGASTLRGRARIAIS